MSPPSADLHLVPETLLKKRHDLDSLRARRAAASITNPQISRKRISDKSKVVKIVKPETILMQSRARKNLATRYNRVSKKGMQKRASDTSVVKNKYWDGEREEEVDEKEVFKKQQLEEEERLAKEAAAEDEDSDDEEISGDDRDNEKSAAMKESSTDRLQRIPYKANSINATTVFAILIRPTIHKTPKPVRKTLSSLRLRRLHEGVFLQYTPATRKMLHLVEPYVLYGVASMETISDLVRRRGFCRIEGKRVPLADNNVIEQELGDEGMICVEDLIQVLYAGGMDGANACEDGTFGKVSKFLWPFRLTSRKSKFQKRMLDLKDGKVGEYGDQGEAMNGFIREML
jgi:large subunit ribosomal protein L7e|mmetsp:Transcript_10767/g.23676  ORF Transcript_10767/g.23676 Transcript_10767/m.23676 type:complete len:344 (-) Transcript_10767:82-1113(-)